jgi:hypothetical protein
MRQYKLQRRVALLVRGTDERALIALRQDILLELADIEGSMDAAWAGSLDLKRRKRRLSALIVSLLSLSSYCLPFPVLQGRSAAEEYKLAAGIYTP